MRAVLLRKGKKEVDRREGRGGREEEGICRTNVKVLPTPPAYVESVALLGNPAAAAADSACDVVLTCVAMVEAGRSGVGHRLLLRY